MFDDKITELATDSESRSSLWLLRPFQSEAGGRVDLIGRPCRNPLLQPANIKLIRRIAGQAILRFARSLGFSVAALD